MLQRIILTLAACLLSGLAALAQDRGTVFVHGLASGPATWDEVVGRLTPQLAIQAMQADLDWRVAYAQQAAELEGELGGVLAGDAVAVGHSNGGIVAREWSRGRPVGSLITLAAPNQGAPLVDHLFEWLRFLDDILLRVSNVNELFANRVDQNAWWWLPAQWTARFGFGIDIWNIAGQGTLGLGFDRRHPVMPEMRVFSPYMSELNSSQSRDREAAAVPARAAIVNVIRDFDHGGPFRMLAPDNYEAWHVSINIAGIALEGLAGVIRVMADIEDQDAFELADHVSFVAEWFLQFEEVWCRVVSDPSPLPIGRCYEHDGIVPAWSQAYDYPRLPLIVRTDGPIHTQETAQSDAQLYQALTNIAFVPPRPAGSTPATATSTSTGSGTSTTGRYKLDSAGLCYWDARDTGPNQCTPAPPPTGRYKVDAVGTCYWDANDSGPNQCSPTPASEPAPTGRFKVDWAGACYWEPNDSGPDQCAP